jgi:hypothetical protein
MALTGPKAYKSQHARYTKSVSRSAAMATLVILGSLSMSLVLGVIAYGIYLIDNFNQPRPL